MAHRHQTHIRYGVVRPELVALLTQLTYSIYLAYDARPSKMKESKQSVRAPPAIYGPLICIPHTKIALGSVARQTITRAESVSLYSLENGAAVKPRNDMT